MQRKKAVALVAIGGALLMVGWAMRQRIAEAAVDVYASLTGKKGEFVKRYVAAWAQTSRRLPLEFLLPQASFESGWGTSRIAQCCNNLHGRMGSGDAGTVPGTGKEWNAATGQYEYRKTTWAAFSSWSAAIESQYDFLLNPKRRYYGPYYNQDKGEQAPGLNNVQTVQDGWRSIVSAGYATEDTQRYVDRISARARDLHIDPATPLRVA